MRIPPNRLTFDPHSARLEGDGRRWVPKDDQGPTGARQCATGAKEEEDV